MTIVKGIPEDASCEKLSEPPGRAENGATINLILGLRCCLKTPKSGFYGATKYSIGSAALPF